MDVILWKSSCHLSSKIHTSIATKATIYLRALAHTHTHAYLYTFNRKAKTNTRLKSEQSVRIIRVTSEQVANWQMRSTPNKCGKYEDKCVRSWLPVYICVYVCVYACILTERGGQIALYGSGEEFVARSFNMLHSSQQCGRHTHTRTQAQRYIGDFLIELGKSAAGK